LTRFCIILIFYITINGAVFAANEGLTENQYPDAVKFESARSRRGPPNAASYVPFEIDGGLLSREQQLIFGLVTLNRRQYILGDDGYTYYLRELLKITGFTADEAKLIISQYEGNPQKWLAVLQSISNALISSGTQNDE